MKGEIRTIRADGSLVLDRVVYRHPALTSHIGARVEIKDWGIGELAVYFDEYPPQFICYLTPSNRIDEVGRYWREFSEMRELFLDLWDEYPDTIADATRILRERVGQDK